jgi:hypothetical protein
MWKRNIERCRDELFETVKKQLVRILPYLYF